MMQRRVRWPVWLCFTAQLLVGPAAMVNAVLCVAGPDHVAVEASHELIGCPATRGASSGSISPARRCVDSPLLRDQLEALISPSASPDALVAYAVLAVISTRAEVSAVSLQTAREGVPSPPVFALRAIRTIILLV